MTVFRGVQFLTLHFVLILFTEAFFQAELWSQTQTIHIQAHAHNDYLHKRPLLDALENGFCSVEADILLVDGELLVAHSYFETKKERTLEKLYLKPLQDRIRRNKGKVYHQPAPFRLLIDIKTDAKKTFQELDKQLKKYPDVFCHYKNGKFHQRPVFVIISGNRPVEVISNQKYRMAAIDGRLSDLAKEKDSKLFPLISDRWRSHFKWRGKGPISDSEKTKLKEIVKKAHQQNKLIRFWAIPDNPNAWKVMKECGVDLINTDKLKKLNEFLSRAKNLKNNVRPQNR